jgi:hypothetical protein
MIAVPSTGPDLSPLRAPSRSNRFQPLDSDTISEAIPTFFIGQNNDGFWVVREAHGRIGGIFLFKGSARWFAKKESRSMGCATIFLLEPFDLDLENSGNPFIAHLAPLVRLATELKRRLKELHVA